MSGLVASGAFVLPTGTVAFLLTDIEGSTPLWESEADAMSMAMAHHERILDAAVSAHGGVRPPAQGEGDSIVAAFSRASDAVLAALDAQRAFAAEEWPTSSPLRVRMAVHSGEARFVDDGNYAGQAIIRTARLRAIAHGGQVLVSAPARDLTVDQLGDSVTFVDLGEHRLRDLARPERVYQLTNPAIPSEFPPLRSLDAHMHNLPVQLSSFIGRTDDIATVVALAKTNRLVTITGAGGAGKTRLALQAAAELAGRWPDGTWWVELAEIIDPDAIAAAIASALQATGAIGENAVDPLADVIGDRRMLVVLDNCEHLVARVARDVDRLLRRCPGLNVLATSREPLEVSGEVAWRIPPLAVPDSAATDALAQCDSVRLFLDRAQHVRANFHLTDDTAPVVAGICQRLDGIPLAIELAAARVRSLTPAQILDGLADAFRLLSGSGRASQPRQRTLEASITWSHDLLAADEQVLFRRLAVFNGGCTLEDAEAVVADQELESGLVLDLVDRLVAQSLVTHDDRGSSARYRMLETVRQYAHLQLGQAGETEILRARHAEQYHRLALELGPQLEGRDEHIPLARLLADHDNIRTALDTMAATGRWRDVAGVCCALAHVWETVAPAEGVAWLSKALDETDPSENSLRARLLVARAYIHLAGGNIIEMAVDGQTALLEAESAGDEATAARATVLTAVAVALSGFAEPDFDQLAERCHRTGDLYGELSARVWPSIRAFLYGDTDRGWHFHAKAEPLVTATGNHMMTSLHRCAAALGRCVQGDFDAVEGDVAAAETSLGIIAGAAGIELELLLRRSVPGAFALFSTTWRRLVRDQDAAMVDRLDGLVSSARAEGSLFAEMTLSLIATGVAIVALEPDAALARAVALAERAQQLGAEPPRACAVWIQGCALYALGDLGRAKAVLDELEDAGSKAMPHYIHARNRHLRGALLLAGGALGEAEAVAHEALSIAVRHTFRWEAAMSLELLASIATASHSWVEAARLLGAAARLRDDFDNRWVLAGHDRQLAADLTTLKSTLGDDFDTAFAEGYALSLEEATGYAQRTRGERKRPNLGWESLTPTELQVVEQVQAGLTNPQIAEKLLMSRETVKTHVSHVFTKLGVRTRTELATAAAKHEAVGR